MALLMLEGFDHFSSDAHGMSKGWDSLGTYHTIGTSYGRFGGRGMQISWSSPGATPKKNIGADKTTIYFGVAIKKFEGGTPGYSSSDESLITIYDESSVKQVRIHVNSSYGLSAYQGDNTLLGSTANNIFEDQRWFYLEGKITISATVGEVTLRVNEIQVLNLTSQDTKNGSDYIRYFGICSMYNDMATLFDDIYIDDAEFHGDCQVKTFLPDDVSTTNNSFTASAGAKDECVDDNPPTDDTDYIYSNTLNHKQGFSITTGTLGTVKGIQLNNFTRDDAAGSRKITNFIRSNGTDYSGTESDQLTADYKFEHDCWDDDPDDSNPWTQTKLEAAEFGLEITT